MNELPGSSVASRRERVTASGPQAIAPPPALVMADAYLPFYRNCVCGKIVCGVR
jgi:hypothetical protein